MATEKKMNKRIRLTGDGDWWVAWIPFDELGDFVAKAANKMPLDELHGFINDLKGAIDTAKKRIENNKF